MPAINKYVGKLARNVNEIKAISKNISTDYQVSVLNKLSENLTKISDDVDWLEVKYEDANKIEDIERRAFFIKDTLLPSMAKLRKVVDECETLMPKHYWPMPTYEELLFSEH